MYAYGVYNHILSRQARLKCRLLALFGNQDIVSVDHGAQPGVFSNEPPVFDKNTSMIVCLLDYCNPEYRPV